MKLTVDDLRDVLKVLEKIDEGTARPRVPGHIGRFFRQYEQGRVLVDHTLQQSALARRKDGAVSGEGVGAVALSAMIPLDISVMDFPLGEVATNLSLSEELGSIVSVVLWMKGPTANAVQNALKASEAVRLAGDYRWTPVHRVTPGVARMELSQATVRWHEARFLKAVADDLARPPHALEYLLDYRIGRPGLKFFRCVCARQSQGRWVVMPALRSPAELVIEGRIGSAGRSPSNSLAKLLICREPWSQGWTIVEARAIEPGDCVAHAIEWADFRCELGGSKIDAPTVERIKRTLDDHGIAGAEDTSWNLIQRLLPVCRDLVKQLRGV